MKPQLSRTQAESLMRYQHEGITPEEVYGRSIGDVTEERGYEWLEAAVTAGFVPHIDALELAVRADHALLCAEEADFRARGVDGDADFNLRAGADGYRRLTLVLEELIESCELGLATSFRRVPPNAECALKALYGDYAAAAEERARAATERRISALRDMHDLARLESRSPRRASTDGEERAPNAPEREPSEGEHRQVAADPATTRPTEGTAC